MTAYIAKNKKSFSLIVLTVFLVITNFSYSESWDLSNDMNFLSNPNGDWSYGVAPPANPYPDTTTFKLCDTVDDGSNVGIMDLYNWYDASTGVVPAVGKNLGINSLWGIIAPGKSAGHGACDGSMTVWRWKSPTDGGVTITGSFNSIGTPVTYGIVYNNNDVQLYETDTTNLSIFDISLNVVAGDTVDFVTAVGSACMSDWVTVDANIELGPFFPCEQDNNTGFLFADLNNDCYVNFNDFVILASEWLSFNDANIELGPFFPCEQDNNTGFLLADLNNDCYVNFNDLVILASEWLSFNYE